MSQDNTSTIAITEAGESPDQISGGGLTSLIPMLLIFVVFYFLLIRPQEKKRKAQEKLVSTVKPGENIVTHSGIFGKITKVNENDNSVNLEVAKGTDVKVMRSAIADILDRTEEAPKKAAAKPDSKKADAKKAPAKKTTSKKTPAKKAAPKKSKK